MRGDRIGPVVFRFVIAIAFIVLGIGTLRTP